MRHEWFVIRAYGIRFWLAYILVRLAHRLKDTTFHQVIRTADGSAVMIEADMWGGGVQSTLRIDSVDGAVWDWPVLREFDDFDEAYDWMHERSANPPVPLGAETTKNPNEQERA